MNKLFLLVFISVVSGCATPYGAYSMLRGGYKDSRIDENSFSISVAANGYTSKEQASKQAMYRAAEVTLENNFDYFTIISGDQKTPPQLLGLLVGAYIHTPEISFIIKTYRGQKPVEANESYDARTVISNVGPAINAPSTFIKNKPI